MLSCARWAAGEALGASDSVVVAQVMGTDGKRRAGGGDVIAQAADDVTKAGDGDVIARSAVKAMREGGGQ